LGSSAAPRHECDAHTPRHHAGFVQSYRMSDLDQFKQYYALADKLHEMMTLEQIRDCMRMLALHLADYRARFGVVERRDLLELVGQRN